MERSVGGWVFLSAFSLASLALGQAPASDKASVTPALAFEVASVKPAGPLDPQKIMSGQQRLGLEVDNARVTIYSTSLNELILMAFKVKQYQISGPSWLNSGIGAERFEVRAKLPDGASKDQVPEMLQTLLAERFALKFHRETAEHNIYALVVGKNGPKMKDAPPDDVLEKQDAPPAPGSRAAAGGTSMIVNGSQVRMDGNPQSGMVVRGAGGMGPSKITMNGTSMHMENPKMNMEMLTTTLSRFVDRPIVDMTGLKGFYQVAIDISRDEITNVARNMGGGMMMVERGATGGAPGDSASEPSGGSIFQSVQQMGLKLEPRKAPVDKIVLDHLERQPTEN